MPVNNNYITYSTAFTNTEITSAIAAIESATLGMNRDLLIVASMVLVLCLSDPSIIQDAGRLRNAIDNLSHQICFVVSGTDKIDPKDMN